MPHSPNMRWTENGTKAVHLNSKNARKFDVAKKMNNDKKLEGASKKAGFYVHGHKNFGDVYEA